MTSIEKLISSLENELDSAWKLPMSGGKIFLDASEIKNLISEVKENLPMELVQAKKIVQNRSSIIEKARIEAETIIKNSEEKIKSLVNNNQIMKAAKIKAENVLADATSKAKELRTSADEYASNIMKRLDETVSSSLLEIKKVRKMFHSNVKDIIDE